MTSEDPARGFAPDAGHIHTAHFPGGPWVRVDTHVFPGYTTPPYYDSLLAKVVVWGRDRSEAIARMRRAVDETQIRGVQTNLDYLALVLSHPRFEAGEIDVDFVERHLAEMQPLRRARARRRPWCSLAQCSNAALTRHSSNSGGFFRSARSSIVGSAAPWPFRRCTRWTRATTRPPRCSSDWPSRSTRRPRSPYPAEVLRAATSYAQELVRGVLANRAAIDGLIQQRAPLWPLAQMSAVDRNVLRIGLYESLYGNATVPLRTAINEAVELAKLFGSETSAKFVNGVLGRAVEASASGEWPRRSSPVQDPANRASAARIDERRTRRTPATPPRYPSGNTSRMTRKGF